MSRMEPHTFPNWVIWKYPLELAEKQRIAMPEGAQLLSVQVQNGEPVLWALHMEPSCLPSEHAALIFMHMTGRPFDGRCQLGRFISTTQLLDGKIVLHWFGLVRP